MHDQVLAKKHKLIMIKQLAKKIIVGKNVLSNLKSYTEELRYSIRITRYLPPWHHGIMLSVKTRRNESSRRAVIDATRKTGARFLQIKSRLIWVIEKSKTSRLVGTTEWGSL